MLYYETSLSSSEYKCKRINTLLKDKFLKEFVLEYRNRNLAKEISNSKHNKILVIYGKDHFERIINELNKLLKNIL